MNTITEQDAIDYLRALSPSELQNFLGKVHKEKDAPAEHAIDRFVRHALERNLIEPLRSEHFEVSGTVTLTGTVHVSLDSRSPVFFLACAQPTEMLADPLVEKNYKPLINRYKKAIKALRALAEEDGIDFDTEGKQAIEYVLRQSGLCDETCQHTTISDYLSRKA